MPSCKNKEGGEKIATAPTDVSILLETQHSCQSIGESSGSEEGGTTLWTAFVVNKTGQIASLRHVGSQRGLIII